MKLGKLLLTVCALCVLSGCGYDDEELWNKVNDHETRISALEKWQTQTNNNISALEVLINTNEYITSVEPAMEDGVEVGYTITFSSREPITLYHGKNGAQGAAGVTPVISLTKLDDGDWYWTVNGSLMKDDKGNPIRANGHDGKDGQDGEDGQDGSDGWSGSDGADGKPGAPGTSAPTPQILLGSNLPEGAVIGDKSEVDSTAFYLSVDGGKTWYRISGEKGETGQAGQTGPAGGAGISVTIHEEEGYVTFTVEGGSSFDVPLVSDSAEGFKIGIDEGNGTLSITSAGETIALKFPAGISEEDITNLTAEVIGESDNSDIATRSSDFPVSATIVNTGESFLNAKLQISYTDEIQTGDIYVIRATLALNDGSTLVTARAITLTAPPKIGDIYYSDGSYSTELIDGKTPIGIIFYLTAKDEDKRLEGTAEAEALGRIPTGLVMALKNATWAENEYRDNTTLLEDKDGIKGTKDDRYTWEDFPVKKSSTNFCWYSFAAVKGVLPIGKPGWIETNYDEETPNLVFDDNALTSCYYDFSGLDNCRKIKNEGRFGDLTNYPAFYAASIYDGQRPENSTEWFIPSTGQWVEIIRGLGGVTIEKELANFKVLKKYHISISTSDNPDAFTKGKVLDSINSYLKKVEPGSYTPFDDNKQLFWTSTESTAYNSEEDAVMVNIMEENKIYISSKDKNNYNSNGGSENNPIRVRCILAF